MTFLVFLGVAVLVGTIGPLVILGLATGKWWSRGWFRGRER